MGSVRVGQGRQDVRWPANIDRNALFQASGSRQVWDSGRQVIFTTESRRARRRWQQWDTPEKALQRYIIDKGWGNEDFNRYAKCYM